MIRIAFSALACLLLLAFPFWSGPSGEPAIRLEQATQNPRLYPAAFHAAWRPVLPAMLTQWIAPQATSTLPKAGTSREMTVKTWRDAKGVVHFSDNTASPAHAEDRLIRPQSNQDLLPPTPTLRHHWVFLAILLLLTLVLSQVLARLIARLAQPLQEQLSGLNFRLPRRDRHAVDDQTIDPATPISYQPVLHDPYQTLGMSANASNGDLRAIYQRLCERYGTERSLHLSPSEQEAARLRLQSIEQAWQQIRQERNLK